MKVKCKFLGNQKQMPRFSNKSANKQNPLFKFDLSIGFFNYTKICNKQTWFFPLVFPIAQSHTKNKKLESRFTNYMASDQWSPDFMTKCHFSSIVKHGNLLSIDCIFQRRKVFWYFSFNVYRILTISGKFIRFSLFYIVARRLYF